MPSLSYKLSDLASDQLRSLLELKVSLSVAIQLGVLMSIDCLEKQVWEKREFRGLNLSHLLLMCLHWLKIPPLCLAVNCTNNNQALKNTIPKKSLITKIKIVKNSYFTSLCNSLS